MISKLLIANRGEIACRVIRTAKKLGIKTVAVYSDIDRNSMFVDMADQAYRLGPAPSLQSYLNSEKIIEIAKNTNCAAIHPGFGFLSENAEFADECKNNKLIFVGPPSTAIKKMGSKSYSKKIMTEANVPVVPGYHGDNQDSQFLLEEAKKIGFPVLIKAVMGGGGKGMRIVKNQEEFMECLEGAKRESLKAFKDDSVLIEKYLVQPRHIEIQIFGDHFGNYVHLFERDCSIQRRHQKVIEEAPSKIGDLRYKIGQSAIDAAKAVGYYNAGTVEFIFDLQTNQYYFMEMNTRLQVEHPITEMITGQDLVAWQLQIASGFPLPKKQNELTINGHSFEARVYSENPFNNFLPCNGKLNYFREPKQVENQVRIESGVRQGDEISIFYDPMIAKLVVWGSTREQALLKLYQSLSQYRVLGLPTNLKFLKNVCLNESFAKCQYDTNFIEKNQSTLLNKIANVESLNILAAALSKVQNSTTSQTKLPSCLNNYRMNFNLKKQFTLNVQAEHLMNPYKVIVEIEFLKNGNYDVLISDYKNQNNQIASYKNVSCAINQNNFIKILLPEGVIEKEFVNQQEDTVIFDEQGEINTFTFENNVIQNKDNSSQDNSDPKMIKAPMPCTLVKLCVTQGQAVKKGQPIVILAAMKMEHTIKAKNDFVVKSIKYKEGSFVEVGKLIVELQ